MTGKSDGTKTKPKPSLPVRQVLAGVDGDDESLREGLEWVASASHAQRATYAAVAEADGGISAQRAGGRIPWSSSSARAAINALEAEGLAEVDDSWPALATLSGLGRRVIETLEAEGINLGAEYLRGDDDDDDATAETDTPEADETEGDDEDGVESRSPPSPPSSSLDQIAQRLAAGEPLGGGGEGFARSAPQGESAQNTAATGSSGSNGTQSYAERPAASWDSGDETELHGDDVIAEEIIELASQMAADASQEAMSNLHREHVRALQASAFADLVTALVALREASGSETE